MNEFQKDEKVQALKIKPTDYEKLNKLYDNFVPRQELSAEQTYFSSSFTSSEEISSGTKPSMASMPSANPMLVDLNEIEHVFQKLFELLEKNSKRESIFYTSPEELRLIDVFVQAKLIIRNWHTYFEVSEMVSNNMVRDVTMMRLELLCLALVMTKLWVRMGILLPSLKKGGILSIRMCAMRGDVASARVIMVSFDEFNSTSGLVPSIPMSTVYFCNVRNYVKHSILSFMPFVEGVIPVKYLGVPLISSYLLTNDCKILVERVKNRIEDWKNKSLSFAGRLQLCKIFNSLCGVFFGVMVISSEWRDPNGNLSWFSVRSAWDALRPKGAEVSWYCVIWFPHCIPRHVFQLWLVMRNSLKTQDKLRQWDVDGGTDLNLLRFGNLFVPLQNRIQKEYEDDELEDGPADYPMDGGDDDDGDSFGDDADDEDEDEEEEHLALADATVVVPTVEPVSLPEGT
nr:reverse transcriptase domain, reverse transcriptase zinc-binding domain protein [Tanacetum cinerariifolium]